MMKRKGLIWGLVILTIITVLITMLCGILVIQLGAEYQSGEELISSSEEAYHFDQQTILQANLDDGITVFTPIPFPNELSELTPIPVSWKQDDYLFVARLFMSSVLHEELNDWQLNNVATVIDCKELPTGMRIRSISLGIFRKIETPELNSRQEVSVNVYTAGTLVVYQKEYAPYLGIRSIRWSDIHIPIEQAISIADQQGGAIVRSALSNQCLITAYLDAGTEKNDWVIYYDDNRNGSSVFKIAIDEKSGNYRILREFDQ